MIWVLWLFALVVCCSSLSSAARKQQDQLTDALKKHVQRTRGTSDRNEPVAKP